VHQVTCGSAYFYSIYRGIIFEHTIFVSCWIRLVGPPMVAKEYRSTQNQLRWRLASAHEDMNLTLTWHEHGIDIEMTSRWHRDDGDMTWTWHGHDMDMTLTWHRPDMDITWARHGYDTDMAWS
jgi:hypothetical protein